MSDATRHLCTECWTEGEGSAPKACPVCGTVGAWFVTATHDDRPLKELLTDLFSCYQVPPELEDVLVKPSERPDGEAQAAEDPRTDMDRVSVSLRFEDEGRDVPESDIDILARCPVLWSGWECDFTALIYRLHSTGETGLHVVGGVIVDSGPGTVAMLEERLEAYREAIKETEAFLKHVRKEMPDETAR